MNYDYSIQYGDRDKEKRWFKYMNSVHHKRRENVKHFQVAVEMCRYRLSEHGRYIKWFILPRVTDNIINGPEKSLEAKLKSIEDIIFNDWKCQMENFEDIEKVAISSSMDETKNWTQFVNDNIQRLDDIVKYQLENYKNKADDFEALKTKWTAWLKFLAQLKKGKKFDSRKKDDRDSKIVPPIQSLDFYPKERKNSNSSKSEEMKSKIMSKSEGAIVPHLVSNKAESHSRKADNMIQSESSESSSIEQDISHLFKPVPQITSLGSTSHTIWLSRALEFANCHRYNDAITCFLQILENESQNFLALYGLAICHSMLHNYPKATAYYKMLDKMVPKEYINGYMNNKALNMARMGDFGNAERILKELTKKDDEYIIAKNSLAIIYHTAGKYDEACHIFDNILEKDNQYQRAYNNKGICY